MDETRAAEILDELTRRGYIEERENQIHPTRRWNAKLQAAAEKLNILASQGHEPDGNPLIIAITQALANENLELHGADFDDAVRVLVTLELTRMGPTKRALAGFPNIRLDDDKPDDAGMNHPT